MYNECITRTVAILNYNTGHVKKYWGNQHRHKINDNV
jgi:hypothetical protein